MQLVGFGNCASTQYRSIKKTDLVQIYVERDIADGLGLSLLVSEFALKPRKLLL